MNFREQNKTLTSSELLGQNPPATTYYSSRKYEPDLKQIAWFDSLDQQFSFTEDEKALLKSNYFMVSERLSHLSWLEAFIQVYNNDLPLFISTDFILYTLHYSYDEILKRLEYEILEPDLIELMVSMYDQFSVIYNQYKDIPELALPLEDVDLYLAVANSLLRDKEVLPQKTGSGGYYATMDAVNAQQLAFMPLFTREDLLRKLDFSQFKPRGHYTDEIYTSDGTKTLENYFRAMMWLGRIDFMLTRPPDYNSEIMWNDQDLLRMNLAALILNEVLYSCGKMELLDKHEEIISFMVGESDNLTPVELNDLSTTGLAGITDLLDQNRFEEFSDLLNSSDDYGQKIMSNFFIVDPDTTDPKKLPVSFRLLGQKFLIDSYIFSEVVYDRIIFNGEKQLRMMPDPLDIFSVLGNEDAMALTKNEMEKYNYAYKVSELKYLVDSYEDDFWTGSLYNTWLSSLISLNPSDSVPGFPYFMLTSAWHHEKLNTQLTSWALLRHDNILYAKQSYTGGTSCSFPYAYVEPYPDFFEQIGIFARNASSFFSNLLEGSKPALSDEISGYYDRYGEILFELKDISLKELKKEALSEDQMVFLKTMINDFMASGPSVSGWINELMFPSMDPWGLDFNVADVHTQPTDEAGNMVGNVLHVGNGLVNLGVFIAPCSAAPAEEMCYVGPVGSFHIQVKDNFYRLDDDEWESMFLEGKNPPRPDWAYAYLADINGDTIFPKNVLKGVEYMNQVSISSSNQAMDYLLLYPNPVQGELHLRFILKERSDIGIDLYDIRGRKVKSIFEGSLPAAEHDLSASLKENIPGVYIVQMKVDGISCVRRCILE